jgi:hypothetical protein
MTIPSLAVALALGAVSTSELGVTVAGAGRDVTTLLAACPRTLRVAATVPVAEMGGLVSAYRASCTGGTVLVELPPYAGPLLAASTGTALAAQQADFYWTGPGVRAVVQELARLGAPVTHLVGPAQFDTAPSWRTDPSCATAQPCAADTAAAFWGQLAVRAAQESFTLLVPVAGVPPPRPGEPQSAFCDVMNGAGQWTLGAATATTVGWSWLGEATDLSKDQTAQAEGALGHRRLDAECGFFFPYAVEIRARSGWASLGSAAQWLDWLRFYDAAVRGDAAGSELVGVTVFAIGVGAGVHDLAPLAPQLAQHLADPAVQPPADGGQGGVGGPAGPSGGGGDVGQARGSGCGHAGGGLALLGLLPLLRLSRRR